MAGIATAERKKPRALIPVSYLLVGHSSPLNHLDYADYDGDIHDNTIPPVIHGLPPGHYFAQESWLPSLTPTSFPTAARETSARLERKMGRDGGASFPLSPHEQHFPI